MLDGVENDLCNAYATLTAIRVLNAGVAVCEVTSESNSFLTIVYDGLVERLFVVIGRLLDKDSSSASLVKTLKHFENNLDALSFSWNGLDPLATQRKKKYIHQDCKQGGDFLASEPLIEKIKIIRDKSVAHRDLKAWMGKTPMPVVPLDEVEEILTDMFQRFAALRMCFDGVYVECPNVEGAVKRDGINLLAASEALLKDLIDDQTNNFNIRERYTTERDALGEKVVGLKKPEINS